MHERKKFCGRENSDKKEPSEGIFKKESGKDNSHK